ncbi:selenocysteine-specific translation elongation factor [Actinocatenispora thailandica]|uniref:Selenocysteine-specific translation elongation factor n=1 Tax=Actinocatenispora thailandica TaxID=227318 RepID=A0A7R7DM48_9ACTN|nr:selenocysteine-specific translation elongation factor [Actinocatenispora thailandica]BCJ34137.1 selenocysteine-specific translation elongation factor [Actinocatenispora thailandica]
MQVIATAGHVDHGKSTLLRALTGRDPDRWAEEHRRGLTIDLGYVWTTLASGATVAFVDVPGHARFVSNMLAGVGPVPAVLFVVAADEGWMPQSTEHLDALAALGVRHGVLAITRCDRADPAAATAAARERLAGTPLSQLPAVPVSGTTGAGLDELRAALDALVRRLPVPEPDADVRLWIDRSFTIRGAGTVVTGTLPAGTVRVGDGLLLSPQDRPVTVRGLHCLDEPVGAASGVARVALNLRGVDAGDVPRGAVLLSPGRWRVGTAVDVRLSRFVDPLPRQLHLHVGAVALPVRVRRLGADTARILLPEPLPLRIGDRLILREPGRHRIVAGASVLDPAPPPLGRPRPGDPTVVERPRRAADRAAELAAMTDRPDLAGELRRRGLARVADLAAIGVPAESAAGHRAALAGGWLADPALWRRLGDELVDQVARHARDDPLSAGLPVAAARRTLRLPSPALVLALADGRLRVTGGRLTPPDAGTAAPGPVEAAVATLLARMPRPWAAPTAAELAGLDLGPRELAAAVRAGLLVELASGVVVAPDAPDAAVAVLTGLPQPFTLSAARQALGTTRRVAVPLLELLDRQARTRRLPDSRRRCPADRPAR